MEKILNPIQKSTPLKILLTLVFAGTYIITEPTLNSMYFLYFTYRMQTLVVLANYVVLATVYLLTLLRLWELYQARVRLDLGAVFPYVLVYLCYLTATLANPATGDLMRWADSFFYSLIPLLIAFLFFSFPRGKHYYISVVATIYLILSLANIIFALLPQLYVGDAVEWREDFFLGFENKAGWSLIMGAFFSLMDWKQNGAKWKTLFYFVLLLVNIRLIWCITALLGTAIIFFYFLLPFVRKWFQKWDFLVFVGIIIILFLCLMFFQKYTVSSEPVALFIEEVLHKKRSLSGRLPLWQLGVPIVLEHPWLGVGAQLHSGFILMSDEYGVWSWYHAHNELLQTWYEGGLLTVSAALYLLVFTAARFRTCKDHSAVGLCKLLLFVFLFMQLSDNMPYYLWYMVGFVAHVSVMICGEKTSKNSRT